MVIREPSRKPNKTLVHICCAPDASYGVRAISERFGNVVCFFYNPNIWPREEYEKRLEETRKLARIYGVELIEGPYNEEEWLQAVKGLENEPEKGKRCEVCVKFRLEKCAELAEKLGVEAMTTVLTVSPKKNVRMINEAGREIGQKKSIFFIELDLKKKDGFKKSVELSKKLNIYRQNYCGCRFSIR